MAKVEGGPGTSEKVTIKRKEFKAEIGAIEHKHRPECVYVKFSTWAKPNLSLKTAQQSDVVHPDELSKKIMDRFKSGILKSQREIAGCFDSRLFYADSIIIDFDFASEGAKAGKRQFVEIEINIDTVNDICGPNDTPCPDRTGKMQNIHFKDFKQPLIDAINKILSMQVFKTSEVSFAVTKGG